MVERHFRAFQQIAQVREQAQRPVARRQVECQQVGRTRNLQSNAEFAVATPGWHLRCSGDQASSRLAQFVGFRLQQVLAYVPATVLLDPN
jgi:hypothetical protein